MRLLGVVVAGLALAVAAESVTYLPEDPGLAAADATVGLAYIGLGAIAWQRRPSSRSGLLMAATGVAWFAGSFAAAAVFLHRGPLVHLLVGYPRGRLRSRLQLVVVAVAYVDGAVSPLARQDLVTVALSLAVFLAVLAGFLRTGGAERRARAAALAAASAVALCLGLGVAGRIAGVGEAEAWLWAYQGVLVLVAVGLFADLLWGRWTQAAITGLVVDLGAADEAGTLRAKLAHAVGDPSLHGGLLASRASTGTSTRQAVRWSWPPSARARTVTHLRDGRPGDRCVGTRHRRAGRPGPGEGGGGCRQRGGRQRSPAGGSSGTGQRGRGAPGDGSWRPETPSDAAWSANSARAPSGGLPASPSCSPTADRSVTDLRRELQAARADLTDFARGVHPRTLTETGLAAALAELSGHSPVPVQTRVPEERLPPTVEAAVYYVCSEALTNVAKHAMASRAGVQVERRADLVAVEVTGRWCRRRRPGRLGPSWPGRPGRGAAGAAAHREPVGQGDAPPGRAPAQPARRHGLRMYGVGIVPDSSRSKVRTSR